MTTMKSDNISSADTSAAQTSGRRPRQARGESRVNTILDACSRLLVEQGEPALTMHGIAREAHTSIGSLYHFFADKPQVLQALLERHYVALSEIAEEADRWSDRDWRSCTAEQLLERLVMPYMDYLRQHEDFIHLIRRDRPQQLAHKSPLEPRLQALFLHIASLRLPNATELTRQAYAAALFGLPQGLLTQAVPNYSPMLRTRIIAEEIPRAMLAYIKAVEQTF